MSILDQALRTSSVGVCVKDTGKRVLMQDALCRETCGERCGEVCETGCMHLYAEDRSHQWKDWGSRVYRNSQLDDGRFYDITLVCSDNYLITLLQPLQDRYAMAVEYYRQQGLTRRETEVMSLAIKGMGNSELCERLSITRTTLRTHLNNVYNKLRDSGEVPEFIPSDRLNGPLFDK